MNIEDVVKWAENLIVDQTGENLTPLQEAILRGVWQRQKYPQIAQDFKFSESYVKKEAAKLWKKLGEELGKDLNKFNFRSKLEKKHNVSQESKFGYCVQINEGNINICGECLNSLNGLKTRSPSDSSSPDTPQNQNKSPIINLTKAPELNYNYGRNSETSTLKEWILENQTRLITIYGLSGIGKTALTLKLISEINTQFDYIIYRSLEDLPKLINLKDELKQFFSQSQTTPLPEIIDYFRSSRCLVILDDVQNIFKSGNFAGEHLTEYKDYGKFFKQIATSSHQSCLILISWEKPREITTLEAEKRSTQTLHLKGLGEEAKEILRQKDLIDEEKWSELIAIYQGHPQWLNIIYSTIIELFNGSVSLFLTDQNDIFLGDIELYLESQLERLSDLEKQVILWLASQDEPIDISQKPGDLAISKSEFREAIQSLGRRCLVEKIAADLPVKFRINPIFQKYLYSQL